VKKIGWTITLPEGPSAPVVTDVLLALLCLPGTGGERGASWGALHADENLLSVRERESTTACQQRGTPRLTLVFIFVFRLLINLSMPPRPVVICLRLHYLMHGTFLLRACWWPGKKKERKRASKQVAARQQARVLLRLTAEIGGMRKALVCQ
jgi:hypothetical protein